MNPPENKTDENHFEKMSDYPILHICSYLPGDDLLKLSQMDRKFNRIVTGSKQTRTKIPLILDFNQRITIDEVMELAQKRQFTTLKLKNVNKTIAVKFTLLLELLSGSVKHLEIMDSEFKMIQLRWLIQLFVPKLITCKVNAVVVKYHADAIISDQYNPDHPLQSLSIKKSDSRIIKFFDGCHQLKMFESDHGVNDDKTGCIGDFLSHQAQLEKLHCAEGYLDFGRLICFQLKELKTSCGDRPEISMFLEKLQSLEKLDISFYERSYHHAMTAICNAPKLKELYMRIYSRNAAVVRCANHSVKKLGIFDAYGIVAPLLKTFCGAESVKIVSSPLTPLDLSDVPFDRIEKIEFEGWQKLYMIKLGPTQVPSNRKSFESAVTKFALKFSENIIGIAIGHVNWRHNRGFRLSNSFCETLITCLPNLFRVELYNIENRGKFLSYLDDNGKIFEKLTLHKAYSDEADEADKVVRKKMRIEID